MTIKAKITGIIAVAAAVSMAACSSTSKDTEMKNTDNVTLETSEQYDSQVLILDQEPLDSDKDIEVTDLPEDEANFDELEVEFSSVNKEQLQADLKDIDSRLQATETELDQARSLLDELVAKNQPAPQIEAQKKKVVVLEDQMFDLADEKLLKQIEAEIE